MSVINLILASEFDLTLGPQIKRQYPITAPLLKDQLPFLSEIVIPDQLHNKSIDKEDYTLFPIYYNKKSKTYKYSKTETDDDRSTSTSADGEDEQLILFTVCNYKYDTNINRNYSIKSLSIVTKLPFFIIFKPIMIMLLEDYFRKPENFDPIVKFFHEINGDSHSFLHQLSSIGGIGTDHHSISNTNTPYLLNYQFFETRLCYLEFLKQNEFNSNINKFEIVFGSNFEKTKFSSPNYTQNKDNLEIMIPIEFQLNLSLKIPIRLSIHSILGSSLQFFGYNLDHDNILKSFFNTVDLLKLNIKLLNPNTYRSLFPFESRTPVLIVLINAVLTRQKIVVMSYTKPIMMIIEFILSILILLHEDSPTTCSEILQFNTFPYFDISKMDLLKGLDSFIIGTTNPIFKNLTRDDGSGDTVWDLFIDLDSNEMIVGSRDDTGTMNPPLSSPGGLLSGLTSPSTTKQRHSSTISSSSVLSNGSTGSGSINGGIIGGVNGSSGSGAGAGSSNPGSNSQDKRVRSFNMKFPNSFKLMKFNKRGSVNSTGSTGSTTTTTGGMIIDEYFKDDYASPDSVDGLNGSGSASNANGSNKEGNFGGNGDTNTAPGATPTFKFEFEKMILINTNSSRTDLNQEIDQDFIIDKLNRLKEKISNKEDDILIYIDFQKNIRIFGYDLILKNLKLSYNLNKLISYRTFKYENEFKGMSNYTQNINKLLQILEDSVIEYNNNRLTLPYNFNIFQFNEVEKSLSEYYNGQSIKFFNFIKFMTNLPSDEVNLRPIVIEKDLKYSINIIYYIDKLFDMFTNLQALKIEDLLKLLVSFRKLITQLTSTNINKKNSTTNEFLLSIFYHLNSITRPIKFGNSLQDLSFIQILIILKKFIKTSEECSLEIDQIFAKFKEQWYCAIKIEESVNDFVD